MEKKNTYKWKSIILDLIQHSRYQIDGYININLEHVEGRLGSRTSVYIYNPGYEGLEILLDWHGIPARRKRKIYDVDPHKGKRLIVPHRGLLKVFWKNVKG